MKLLNCPALIAFLLLCGPVLADETPGLDVPKSAEVAVACIDRFTTALSAGDLDGAAVELDPDVLILESGGAEHSAAEYLGSHAAYDAEFLASATHRLLRRTARVSGDTAWIASESEFQVKKGAKPTLIASTETMVLRSGASGWKIVHIHWSSKSGE
jgi:ketosteroid isomerase-like protein